MAPRIGPRRSAVPIAFVVLTSMSFGQTADAAAPRCLGRRATIVGDRKADVLRGTPRADVIVGLGGGDVIKGRGGADRICGGNGDDRLLGGAETDTIDGGSGDDKVSGGGAADDLFGGQGNDAVSGGGGFDWISFSGASRSVDVNLSAGSATGEGSDTVSGVEGVVGSNFADVLAGDAVSNWFVSLAGDDDVNGSGDFDGVSYGFATSRVTVDLAKGTATGIGEGTDTLSSIERVEGSDFGDTLTGDAGPNVFWGYLGDDAIDGGSGEDWVSYFAAPTGVTVDLVAGTATGEGTDALARIEHLFGSRFGDSLSGNAAPNLLQGLGGDDSLAGADGNDTLIGGEATDTADGGNGVDQCEAETEAACELDPTTRTDGIGFPRSLG